MTDLCVCGHDRDDHHHLLRTELRYSMSKMASNAAGNVSNISREIKEGIN
ncbi:MAG: hypothetical protein QN545_10340 [Nitrososphaeraceae archaeon]|nr:hypothetical protein [Nitrososphaeraceae archaeon]MDW0329019.1 hypothetical protein [Nitrososphaeraceae archaeon]